MRTVSVIILSVLLTLYAQDSTRVNYKRLSIAAGLSIDEYYKDYQAYLSFDIDLEKLSAPVNSRALSTIAHYLNFLKFPAPAIKFQPELKGYWIYY